MRSIARSAALAALFLPTAAYAQGADPAGPGVVGGERLLDVAVEAVELLA